MQEGSFAESSPIVPQKLEKVAKSQEKKKLTGYSEYGWLHCIVFISAVILFPVGDRNMQFSPEAPSCRFNESEEDVNYIRNNFAARMLVCL